MNRVGGQFFCLTLSNITSCCPGYLMKEATKKCPTVSFLIKAWGTKSTAEKFLLVSSKCKWNFKETSKQWQDVNKHALENGNTATNSYCVSFYKVINRSSNTEDDKTTEQIKPLSRLWMIKGVVILLSLWVRGCSIKRGDQLESLWRSEVL